MPARGKGPSDREGEGRGQGADVGMDAVPCETRTSPTTVFQTPIPPTNTHLPSRRLYRSCGLFACSAWADSLRTRRTCGVVVEDGAAEAEAVRPALPLLLGADSELLRWLDEARAAEAGARDGRTELELACGRAGDAAGPPGADEAGGRVASSVLTEDRAMRERRMALGDGSDRGGAGVRVGDPCAAAAPLSAARVAGGDANTAADAAFGLCAVGLFGNPNPSSEEKGTSRGRVSALSA